MDAGRVTGMTRAAGCPICRKPAQARYHPFCSRRCADVDLAHWLRGDYTLPGIDGDAAEEAIRQIEADKEEGRDEDERP